MEELNRQFWITPESEGKTIHQKILQEDTGAYVYFRRIKTPLQAYLSQLWEHQNIPKVFLHGSPHIDNYAKTQYGYGLVDFDRAHIGPYVWDLACVMVALSLRNPAQLDKFINTDISEALYQAYLEQYDNPLGPYRPFMALEKIEPKKWESNITAYIKSGKKWAKYLSQESLALDEPRACELLHQYLTGRDELYLQHTHRLNKIIYCTGTFGRPRYLYLLKSEQNISDDILIDIKETKSYLSPELEYTKWYDNPFPSQGVRMIAAAILYAPQCQNFEGHAQLDGQDYWGRRIPCLNKKPAKIFSESDQMDFAKAAGSQLGRGHRLSLQDITPDEFKQHVTDHYKKLMSVAKQMHGAVYQTWMKYCEHYKQ